MSEFSEPSQPEPARGTRPQPTAPERARVILLGLDTPEGPDGLTLEESLDELGLLVDTWGGEVVGRVTQSRPEPDPAFYVGRGKLEEAARLVLELGADTIVADGELTPVQLRNLEREFERSGAGTRVMDRTQVILEIFARRARSREGKLEVELAQAVYALPRLSGKGVTLSRLGGGIGTRGPGETKLEVDRRTLRDRIADLRREIRELERQREVQARTRREAEIPLAALVGYTNAGKSTLFNRLTGAGVLAEDRLFATLDPVVRRLELPNGQRLLVSDTVGFIRRLPHHLVAAFRATLDEVRWADVLVHVVDASDPRWPHLTRAASAVLVEVAACREVGRRTPPGEPAVVYVLNKTDRLPGGRGEALSRPGVRELAREGAVVALSSLTGEGVSDLLTTLERVLADRRRFFRFAVPYSRPEVVAAIHGQGRVLRVEYGPQAVLVEAEMETTAGLRLRARLEEP